MPTISIFYGIIIRMYWDDHPPPHFHAYYGNGMAIIDIQTLATIRGKLPRTATALVLRWARQHQSELMENWDLCKRNAPPQEIAPLT